MAEKPKDPWGGMSNIPFAAPHVPIPSDRFVERPRFTPPAPTTVPVTTTPLRAVPETCCHNHDEDSGRHDVECLVGMLVRISSDAAPSMLEALDKAMANRATALMEIILLATVAPGSPGSMPAAKVHQMVNGYNQLRKQAERMQNILRDRQDGVSS